MCLKSWRFSRHGKDDLLFKCFLLFSLKLTACTWKWKYRRRLFPFGAKGLFSGAFAGLLLVSGRVSLAVCPLVFFFNMFPFGSNLVFFRQEEDVSRCHQLWSSREFLWERCRMAIGLAFSARIPGFLPRKNWGENRKPAADFCVEKSGYFRVFQGFPTVNLDSKLGPRFRNYCKKKTGPGKTQHLCCLLFPQSVCFLVFFLSIPLFFLAILRLVDWFFLGGILRKTSHQKGFRVDREI